MISKKTAFTWAIILIIVTSMVTFGLTSTLNLTLGDKMLVSKEKYEGLNKFLALREYIKKNYVDGATDEKLMEGAMKGLFEALEDPYSVYMNEEEFKNFSETTSGIYGGIGVIITQSDDGYITIVAPIEDTPGERVGLKTNDKIIKVDGTDIVGLEQDKAVALMKGEPGTTVTITVMRENTEQPLVFDIKRELINIKYVRNEMLENNVGYIRISMFDEDTGKEFQKAVNALSKQGMKGLIIDLRQNPGGLVRECIKVANVLLDEGVIFYTEDINKERETYKSDAGKLNVPYVVLVDGGSASASEILSGAIKDRKTGLIIGTKTFGKGLVQNIRELEDGSGVKLTIQKYYTPSGTSIHKIGVQPDIVIEAPVLLEGQRPEDIKDVQLEKAKEEIMKQLQ